MGAIVKEGEEENSVTNTMTNSGVLVDSDKKAAEIEKAAEDKDDGEEKTNIKRCAVDPNNTQVAYFYAGDLINHILSRLSEIYSAHGIEEITRHAEEMLQTDPAYTEIMAGASASQALGGQHMLKGVTEANEIITEKGGGYGWLGIGEEIAELGEEAKKEIIKEHTEVVAAALGPLRELGLGMDEIKNKFSGRSERFKKFRVVLGPVMFQDFFSYNEIMCSIGDIPIALNHFNSWLADEVEGKGKYRIGLADFLNKFISHYLRSHLLGDKKLDQGVISQKKSFSSTALTAYNPRSTKGVDALTAHRTNIPSRRGLIYEKVSQAKRPILDTTGNSLRSSNAKEAYEYLVFYEKMVHPVMPKSTSPGALSRFGISKFQHGRDRGILKTAQYQATNIEGRREARHQAGKFNGLEQLTEVFDVTLHCYANLQIFNGHRIYLDAKSLVPYLSKETLESLNGYQLEDFGIGGFYIVNNVQHHFEQGKFDTVIRAQWEMWQKDKPSKPRKLEHVAKIEEIQEPLKEACKSVMAPQGGSLGELYDSARSVAESIFGETVTNKIIGFFRTFFDVLSTPSLKIFGTIITGIAATLSGLGSAIVEVKNQFLDFFKTILAFKDVEFDILDPVSTGKSLSKAFGRLKNQVGSSAGDIARAFKKGFSDVMNADITEVSNDAIGGGSGGANGGGSGGAISRDKKMSLLDLYGFKTAEESRSEFEKEGKKVLQLFKDNFGIGDDDLIDTSGALNEYKENKQ